MQPLVLMWLMDKPWSSRIILRPHLGWQWHVGTPQGFLCVLCVAHTCSVEMVHQFAKIAC